MKNFYKKNNKGFSLIELIVALGIFTSIVTVLLGALIVTMNSAKQSRALRTAMDNVNFAMESMSRSIRMGTNYYCVQDVGGVPSNIGEKTQECDKGIFISFIPQGENSSSSRVGYGLIKENGEPVLSRCIDESCVAIVSPDITIESLRFVVKNQNTNERQASVYIMMKGVAHVKGSPIPFALQTMASQRNFQ